MTPAINRLSDRDLLARVKRAANAERHATAHLIALLIEVETRGLHLSQGFSSLFTYCTQALRLSEHAAYNRIETARAARRFPIILARVRGGDVTLTCVRLLAPHLTNENHESLLARSCHKSKREVELLVASIHPQPDVAPTIRKLPAPKAAAPIDVAANSAAESAAGSPPLLPAAPSQPAVAPRTTAEIKPLIAERYKIAFSVDRRTHDRLRRVQDLLRHSLPDGDVSAIFERALAMLERELERTKFASAGKPRDVAVKVKCEPQSSGASSRHVPAVVKRAVWQRDEGRCAYKGAQGRCDATAFLEYHHVIPFAAGGETLASNIELRCRAHNQYEAQQFFGRNSFRNELRAPG